jgi:Xaa-Pro aminopeptidase/Xaa-Pro dipeptidase
MDNQKLQMHQKAIRDRIYGKMADKGIDALIVTDLSAIRWLTGFSGSSARLLLAGGTAHLFTDFRYREQVGKETSGVEAVMLTEGFASELASGNYITGFTVALQADQITWHEMQQLAAKLEQRHLVPITSFFDEYRQIKHEEELRKIRTAVAISEQVLECIIPMISPGVTETDIAAEISYQHRKLGAEKDSFDPIVAGGIRSAMPHARPAAEPFVAGTFVVIDMGCVYQGYASDQTRTVALGRVSDEARKIYGIVQQAQMLGIQAAKAGMSARDLDAEVRSFISAHGYGEAFGHGLGHGVGIDVHEPPRIGSRSEDMLREGMVFTIEPGIYLEGRFGVRIEDMVVLGHAGASPLQSFTKELVEL